MKGDWAGNLLSNEGAWLTLDSVKAYLVRWKPPGLTLKHLPEGVRKQWKRCWVLSVYDDDPYKIDASPLVEMILFNMMPDAARREAEIVASWAEAYYFFGESPMPGANRAGDAKGNPC